MNLKIRIPNNNIQERKYIVDIIFSEFLGINYKIEIVELNSYKILFQNKEIEIKDAFFNNFPEDLSYLKEKNIPYKVIFAENRFTSEKNIPVIYGNEKIEISENKITCGIDIFASSFFMLTRWEEHVISEKDKHNRVPDDLQLSVKHSFNERPVVNEYLEMLRNMFSYLGLKFENKHKYQVKITHDIDFFARYDTFSKLIKAIGGDIFKRKSLKKAINTLKSYSKIKKGTEKDPYDTFDYLMDLSEKAGLNSHFYFIPAIIGEEDAQYNITDTAVVETIHNIKDRGHIVGIHGAYRSYIDSKLFNEELKRFPKNIKIEEGRQHFLRFENPATWQMYEDEGLRTDNTMGFINNIGFRSGTCYEYSLFNILTRKKLNIKEQPLIVMDQALLKKYPDKNEFYNKIIVLKDTVKKYKGTFVLLWHNNNFNVAEWEDLKDVYENIISEIN
ncbi:MAG: polysaccharide deacetylase family protein [Bacteroidales bacterium]|nr:polysaccharide deacetylase family protein [Bacteroidales bacterium]